MRTHTESPTSGDDIGLPVLLRFDEAARLLRISRSRLYEMAARDEIPGLVTFGRSRRIHRASLERWIAEMAGDNAA